MRDKDGATTSGFGGRRSDRLTPADVQQKEFRVSFRGYNERDVDEFLDQVTEELQRFETDLMRLRSERASFDPAAFDLDAETRRILDDARARADEIVREAEARAAGVSQASGADTRAVVAPYLNREREFLQSLGTLVQQHANTIKTMVEEARRRAETSPATAPETPAPAAETAAPMVTATTSDAVAAPPTGDAAVDEAPVDVSADEENDVVVLAADEPVTTPPEAREQDREPEAARSLRELFWGED
jgi:cell division initiation protein